MNDRWAEVERIFHEADEVPPGEREAFLQRACGGDGRLRAEVESLLRAADQEDGGDGLDAQVQRSLREALTPAPAQASERWIGVDVGAYRIVRELGRGGMGVVFLATHREFGRGVAVKLVHAGLLHADAVQRFATERRILANLDHPGIARFIDAGSVEDVPYLVMEYVEGEAVTTYCAKRSASLAERVELMRKVCAAVQHAHRNLVIHRDLKPSNVLVAGGTPKLLDFGIAKLLATDPDSRAPLTEDGQRALTPEYASPEQLRGEPLTTQSDVYSLGVVLYELVAEKRPYPAGHERTKPPAPPSTRARHARGARGDLDNIVLKAMHADVAQRYGSAEELSEDLGRFLAGRPVRAKRDTPLYRMRRFVGRHRIAVGLAALAVVAAAGWVGSQVRSRREALVQLSVTAFMQSSLRGSIQERGARVDEVDLLSWSREPATSPKVSRQASLPETVAAIMGKALALSRQWRGEDHPTVANFLVTLAHLQHLRGEYEEAEKLYRELLALRRRLGVAEPEVVLALQRLASVLHDKGDLEQAELLYRQAVALSRRSPGTPHLSTAVAISNLAGVLEDRLAYDEAEALARESLEMRSQLFGPEHVHVARGLHSLGLTLLARGDVGKGEPFLLEALDMRRRLLGAEHALVGESLAALGSASSRKRDFAGAERQYRRAIGVLQGAVTFGHAATAEAMVGLGEALLDQGAPRPAEPLLREALAMLRMGSRAHGPERARAEVALGACLVALGRTGEGRSLVESGTGRLAKRLGPGHPATLAAQARGQRDSIVASGQ